MQDIITDPPHSGPRPPEPLPEVVTGGSDAYRHYDEPVEPQLQALIAPTVSAQGPSTYDNEMSASSDEIPLNVPPPPPPPPPPKKSAATASAILPAKSLPSSIIEEKGEYQNRRASDLWPLDFPEKKAKSSHVIPASHRRHSEANTNATNCQKKSLTKTHSSPLPELRSPFNVNMPQPAAGESQQCGSYSPAQRENSNSATHDIHGYVICVP